LRISQVNVVKQSFLAALLLAFLAQPAMAEEMLVAAASDLSFVLP